MQIVPLLLHAAVLKCKKWHLINDKSLTLLPSIIWNLERGEWLELLKLSNLQVFGSRIGKFIVNLQTLTKCNEFMAHENNLSIGVFIDGGYYAKINEGFAEKREVNLRGLLEYICQRISKEGEIERKYLYVTECHYYRGRYRANEAKSKNLLYDERKFEDMLIENDVIFHYKHLRTDPRGGVIEKGVDTWFALDTYELTLFRQFDYVVLISGDADHEMLARKLKALKTHVILLTWDPANTASTSRFLKEEVCSHFDMNRAVSEDNNLLKYLTI